MLPCNSPQKENGCIRAAVAQCPPSLTWQALALLHRAQARALASAPCRQGRDRVSSCLDASCHSSIPASTQLTHPIAQRTLPTPYLQAFYPRLYSRCQAEVFIAGNVAQGAALGFAEQLEAQLRER